MANREVSLYLKYPGPPVALQRLQHSFLECVIEYKSGSAAELQTMAPAQVRSTYQLKGTATLVDDELVIQFVPKNAGLHSVRIFGDTRELCRPIAFIINHNSEVESTPFDEPVKMTSSLFHNSPRGPVPAIPSPPYSPSQRTSALSGPQDRESFWKDFPSDPTTSFQQQKSQYPQRWSAEIQGPSPNTSPQHLPGSNRQSAIITSNPISGRPLSMNTIDEGAFAGDLFISKPDDNSFSSLLAAKNNGKQVYGTRRGFLTVDHGAAMTAAKFKMLERDAAAVMTRGSKGKQRCTICNKKVKLAKVVEIGEEDYCETCFKRQFLLRSAIEHFMIPSIKDLTVEVPVNKKATKFVSARKTLPNVNLRGLEPNEIRFATREFRKFSSEDNGWIKKAVLIPLMKACFSYNLTPPEIKSLLTSKSFSSVMSSYGMDERDEVHEIEFLALLAFVARERQRLKGSTDPKNRFTGADLQMAYAFKNHFGTQTQHPTVEQSRPAYVMPASASQRFRTSSVPPEASQIPLRSRQSNFYQQQNRESQLLVRDSGPYPSTAPQYSGQRESLMSPLSQQVPSGFRSQPPSQYDFASDIYQPKAQLPQLSGIQLDESLRGMSGVHEEDTLEDIPALPPNKNQTVSNALGKGAPNKKQMMEELKLTGGNADSWMLY